MQTPTFLVLLNIEATKQHDSLSSVDAAIDLVRGFDVGAMQLSVSQVCSDGSSSQHSLVTDAHDSTTATEAVVEAAKVDGVDAELAQDRGAHDAWLDSDIQVGFLENLRVVFGKDLAQGNELGMTGSLVPRMSDGDREKRRVSKSDLNKCC